MLCVYFLSIVFKDDAAEIDKVVNSFNHSTANIVHIEFLDNNKAIAFYESLDEMYFGSAILKKSLFGWKSHSSSAGIIYDEDKLNWSFSNLVDLDFSNYTDLISGKILDSEIAEVRIKTKQENEYEAKVIEYNNRDKFWFLITDGEDLLGSTITGLSSDGGIIEQIIK